jgi:hypothetical protein
MYTCVLCAYILRIYYILLAVHVTSFVLASGSVL